MKNIYDLLEQDDCDPILKQIMLKLYKDLKINILNDWILNLYKHFQNSKKLAKIKKLHLK